jgi:hypothetical protein
VAARDVIDDCAVFDFGYAQLGFAQPAFPCLKERL